MENVYTLLKHYVKNPKPLKIWNKGIAAKYGVRSNTLSTWVKNKEKLLNSLEKESNTKL